MFPAESNVVRGDAAVAATHWTIEKPFPHEYVVAVHCWLDVHPLRVLLVLITFVGVMIPP